MKKLKQIVISTVVTILLTSVVILSSCKKDACASVSCSNGGSCSSGLCICPSGYSGDRCQTAQNTLVAGTYNGQDCNGSTESFVIIANTGSSPYSIYTSLSLNGSCAHTFTLAGTVDNQGGIYFPSTTYYDGCGNPIVIAISGSVTGNSLSLNLNVTYNAAFESCSFIGNR